MTIEEKIIYPTWSREQDKAFENAIATHTDDLDDRWVKIAADVPGKTLEEVKKHYEVLVEDVGEIECGNVPLPLYSLEVSMCVGDEGQSGNNGGGESGQERRKGIAWTEDEHRLFLLGLEKYGKGDWRSISRNFVLTRTPTQVASHAQKYFVRLNSMNKDRRRTSIHDITSVNNGGLPSPHGPITGQPNTTPPTTPGKPTKPVGGPASVGVYGGPTIGQPIGGTQVNMTPHMAYGVWAPVPGTVVPGMPLMTYPMPHTSTHR